MTDKADIQLDLLLFSVGGVHFGVDAEQVSGMAIYNGEVSDDLFWLHKELGYGDEAVMYVSPIVLTIRTESLLSYRVVIDSIEDIAEFSQNDINLFPTLLEPFAIQNGLWGIIPRNNIVVLLVDFQLLLKKNRN